MPNEPRVLRSFFVERRVDQLVSRASLDTDISKNEIYRRLLAIGAKPFVDGEISFDKLGAEPGSEQSEKEDAGKVLRSIYVDREFDDYMRHAAFDRRVSKSELMRRFIDKALEKSIQGGTDMRGLRSGAQEAERLYANFYVERKVSPVAGRGQPMEAMSFAAGPTSAMSALDEMLMAAASAVRSD